MILSLKNTQERSEANFSIGLKSASHPHTRLNISAKVIFFFPLKKMCSFPPALFQNEFKLLIMSCKWNDVPQLVNLLIQIV